MLVHLLLAAVVLLGLPSAVFGDHTGDVAHVAAVEHDDCCPDTDPTDDADCCDVDFGRCCAGAVSALPAPPSRADIARTFAGSLPTPIPPHLLCPRANGPPPTPPPIA